jgi:iron(III) transport system permease protein
MALRLGGRIGVIAACATVIVVAVAVPIVRLTNWAIDAQRSGTAVTVAGGVWHHTSSSLAVVLATCVACMGGGIAIALLARRRGPIGRLLSRLASLGYAMPGPVVAVGALITLAAFDRAGLVPNGAVLIGSFVGLVFALTTRFMAVAFQGIEAGLDRVPPSAVASARTLGARAGRVAWSVELPAARTSIVAAAALLTVDLMKELPITILLRPFGFDTLSVWVWQATSESLWDQAAVPSLVMVAVGMVAVGALLAALDRGAEVAS